ncbi:MAG TPA: hypothetical protein DC049_15430, partial [Spirochaetia bacterium]|nr:hypothetical protein [Spirochaetia bacterium]
MSYKEYQEFGKWGNEGIVCTLPIKRPQHGNARTLLAGGFDQEWAGAAEYHYGQGVLIICQLDICGRTIADPAADRLLSEFLRYLKDFTPVQYKSA